MIMSKGMKRIVSVAGVLCAVAGQNAYAAGFQLHEQSATYLGTAFAGTAAAADLDASTTYYNPAFLTSMPNDQVVVSGVYVIPQSKLYDASARNNIGAVVNSSPTTHPGGTAVVPGFNMAARINCNWVFGLSIGAPFGLATKYEATSIARYMATTSKIDTININPSLGYKINNKWSVGAGLDVMHLRATLNSAINYGAEGYVNNYGDAWTYGYHLGVAFQPTRDTKMGLVYFSKYFPHVSGDVKAVAYPLLAKPTRLTADITLPDRIVYSISHQYNDKWQAMGDLEWVHWSTIKTLQLNYNNGRSTSEHLSYINTFRLSLGAMYHYSCAWLFKGGFMLDQSPVTFAHRTARLPDSDRLWLALGAKFRLNQYVSLDAAYSHLFFKGASIAQSGNTAGDTAKKLYGNYKTSADLIGMQLTWNFV
jgi:long-chain fatty acid transport protein